MTLKRDLVKYVRDKAKSQYKKDTECLYLWSNREPGLSSFQRSD